MTDLSNRNWLKRRMEVMIGICIGVILMLAIYFGIQFFNKKYSKEFTHSKINSAFRIDTLQSGNYTVEIKSQNQVQIKENNAILEEKIKSLNDRIADIYLSFTIIITLLLAIVVGVYFKTETEVAKHMNRNYAQYKKEIEIINGEAQTLIAEIRAQATLAQQITPKQENPENQSPQPAVQI